MKAIEVVCAKCNQLIPLDEPGLKVVVRPIPGLYKPKEVREFNCKPCQEDT